MVNWTLSGNSHTPPLLPTTSRYALTLRAGKDRLHEMAYHEYYVITADHKDNIESSYPPFTVEAWQWVIEGGPFANRLDADRTLREANNKDGQTLLDWEGDIDDQYTRTSHRIRNRKVKSKGELYKYRIRV